jgi:cellulose synthase/poly-beta-1,6-N-acetylglucosamine synthase-like glycosyltransferase
LDIGDMSQNLIYSILALYGASLLFLLVYSMQSLYFAIKFQKIGKKIFPNTEDDLSHLPYVTIQLPIFNERYVVERLIDSVVAMKYPKEKLEIQVLDDSTDETKEIIHKLVHHYKILGYQIEHIHRVDRSGFKAMALKNGLEFANGDFIAIFDADFIPKSDFLLKTVPFFKDKKTAFVQARWAFINEDYSTLTKIQSVALANHFVIEQTVRNELGLFINFNGTAGIWRKEAIYDAGNWQSDTITEDMDLSFRAQMKGWKAQYLVDYTCDSELPANINSFKSQQFRWTKGVIETAKKLCVPILKSKLSLKEKVFSLLHLSNNLVYLSIMLIAILNFPILYIKIHYIEFNIFFMAFSIFIISFIGPLLSTILSQKYQYKNLKKRLAIIPKFFTGTMGLAINNFFALIEAILGKKTEFVRTPKFNIVNKTDNWSKKEYQEKLSKKVLLEIAFTIYSFISLVYSIIYIELAAVPFHFMFFSGFLMISVWSFQHIKRKDKKRPEIINAKLSTKKV